MKSDIKLILFDIFGTVFDMSSISQDDIAAYVSHVNHQHWSPLELPDSWNEIKAHPDAVEGVRLLRQRFVVCTLSNGPVQLQIELSRRNGIDWDWIVPLEMRRVYKPHTTAYITPFACFDLPCREALMVTANPQFGDLEGAAYWGMQSQVIRRPNCPQTIIELAESLA